MIKWRKNTIIMIKITKMTKKRTNLLIQNKINQTWDMEMIKNQQKRTIDKLWLIIEKFQIFH